MAKRKPSVSPQTPTDVLLERIEALESGLRIERQAKMSSVQTIRNRTFHGATQGMVAINWPTGQFCFYHNNEWVCVPTDLTHAIKVYSDRKTNAIGDGAFRFSIDPKLDNKKLVFAFGFNGTPGTGATTVQVSNRTKGIDMLATRISIAGGATSDFTTAVVDTSGPVADPHDRVHLGNDIWIDVDAVGTGSKGLGVYLYFDYPEILT